MPDAPWAQRKINCGPKTLFSAPFKHAISHFFSTDSFSPHKNFNISAKMYYFPENKKMSPLKLNVFLQSEFFHMAIIFSCVTVCDKYKAWHHQNLTKDDHNHPLHCIDPQQIKDLLLWDPLFVGVKIRSSTVSWYASSSFYTKVKKERKNISHLKIKLFQYSQIFQRFHNIQEKHW